MSSDVLQALTGLQDALLKTDSIGQFRHELAVLGARTTGDGMSCGTALRPPGRPATATASSDPLASEADRAQEFARPASGALTLVLRSVSQNTDVKLRDLTADIVASVSGEAPRLTAPFEEG